MCCSEPATHLSALVVALNRGCNRCYESLHVLAAGVGVGDAASGIGRQPAMQAPKGVFCVATPPVFPLLRGVHTGLSAGGALPGYAPEGLTVWTGSAAVLVHHSQSTAPERQQFGAGQVGVVDQSM